MKQRCLMPMFHPNPMGQALYGAWPRLCGWH